jgi:M6 family metalloprotease-like protein
MRMRRTVGALLMAVVGTLVADGVSAAVALYKTPGSMRDIDVGPGGQIYGVGALDVAGGNGLVYKWRDRNWEPFSGSGVRIAVDGDGNPWLVNASRQVSRFRDGRWETVSAGAQDIAVGGGQVFVVGSDGPGTNGSVARWNGADFVRVGGYGTRITVDPDGRPWVVNSLREVWRHDGSGWVRMPGYAQAIDAGANGTVYMIGAGAAAADGGIFRWTGSAWEENGGFGVEVAVGADGKPAIVNSGAGVWTTFYRELPFEEFGYHGLRTGPRGRRALGERPTLVILLEHTDAIFDAGHPPAYYGDLFFGGAPEMSVDRYFRENSRSQFGLWPGTVVGPVRDPRTWRCAHRREECPGDGRPWLTSFAEALLLPGMAGVDFSRWDADFNGDVTDDELFVVFVSAYDEIGPSTKGVNRHLPGGCAATLTAGVRLCSAVVLVGDGTGLATIAHEMAHSLGAEDVYGALAIRNNRMSLMAATVEPSEDVHKFVHLDPLHKIRLGWVQPAIVPIAPGTKEIRHRLEVPQSADRTARPLLLYDPNRGSREYFLVEYRNGAAAPGSFDQDVAVDGVIVWLVQTRTASGTLVEMKTLVEPGRDGVLSSSVVHDDLTDGTYIWGGPDRILQSTVAPGSDDVYGMSKVDLVVSPEDQQLGRARAFNATHGRVNLRWLDNLRSWVEVRAGAFEPEDSTVEVILTFRH